MPNILIVNGLDRVIPFKSQRIKICLRNWVNRYNESNNRLWLVKSHIQKQSTLVKKNHSNLKPVQVGLISSLVILLG